MRDWRPSPCASTNSRPSSNRNEYQISSNTTPGLFYQRTNNRRLPQNISSDLIEVSRREPPPPYWVHHHHRRPVANVAHNDASSTTTTSSDSDNENQRHNRQLLIKNAFRPDLLHSCPAVRKNTHPTSPTTTTSATVEPAEQDYVEIDEIRQNLSEINVTRNIENDVRSVVASSNELSATGEAKCLAATESKEMGQSLSQRRPRISLTWVLREQQTSTNGAGGSSTLVDRRQSSPQVVAGVASSSSSCYKDKKKYRSKSKDTGERLFSEKYVNDQNPEFASQRMVDGSVAGVNNLLFVCSKNVETKSCGYASDCGEVGLGTGLRNENIRKSDKIKRNSKFTVKNLNLNESVNCEKQKNVCKPEAESNSELGKNSSVCIKSTYSEPSLYTLDGQSRRHRHRRRRERNRSQRFGYEIKNVDDFLSKCSLASPGNIPVVLSSSSTLYQTRPGGYQIEIPLPLGMVVNAVFKNQNWLYVQTPHAEEGYVGYAACLPLGILPQIRPNATSKPQPCWETSGDVFPKPCGNMTDSEKEIQLRGGTRSEGARTPRLKRVSKSCGEKNVDVLYLRATSQPKLAEKSFAHLKSTTKTTKHLGESIASAATLPKSTDDYVLLHHKKPPIYPHHKPNNTLLSAKPAQNATKSLRQTLLAITENYLSQSIAVNKGDVVTLLACKQIQDKRLPQPIQWFYVRSRDGTEGFIPAEVAGHGFL